MKEPLAYETGRIVRSTQGRDKGKYFIVLENIGGGYVMMADGLNHTLEKPKKKKTKHLYAKPLLEDLMAARPEGGKLQNSDLRRLLEKNGFAVQRSLCKEG